MSTNGFISFVANGEAKHAYNHWDSMPDGLGVKVLHWLRMASRDRDALRKAITNLKLVGGAERPYPTEVDVARFHVYADRTVGDPAASWYALLRRTQGDPAAILDCGYIVIEYDEPFGWVYEVNCDDQSLSVDLNGERISWPWSALPADSQFLTVERRLDPDDT